MSNYKPLRYFVNKYHLSYPTLRNLCCVKKIDAFKNGSGRHLANEQSVLEYFGLQEVANAVN